MFLESYKPLTKVPTSTALDRMTLTLLAEEIQDCRQMVLTIPIRVQGRNCWRSGLAGGIEKLAEMKDKEASRSDAEGPDLVRLSGRIDDFVHNFDWQDWVNLCCVCSS